MEDRPINHLRYIKQDFENLYQEYYQGIFGFVKSYVKSADVAEDITQDLFLNIIEREDPEAPIENIKSYLFTSAKNRSLNYLKKASKDLQVKEALYRQYETLHGSLEEDIADLEYQKLLNKYLENLSPQNSTVFKLCREKGKSYQEAAEELGISQSAVKKHMVKSMKILKLLLKKDFGLLMFFIFRF